ncbi:cytochrome C552 [Beijerinckiaceae bacterium]|nr:cytochrome C552 [Beijerinckiaceae bacterium]
MMPLVSTRGSLSFFLACGLLAATLATATSAPGQIVNGDTGMGRQLAKNWCSDCHAVGPNDETNGDGPSFVSIANMPSTTSISLHAFLQTSHERMPNLVLTQTQIDDVVAYILSLRSE